MDSYKPEKLRHLILNSNEPVLVTDKLKWGLLTWTLDDWAQLLKAEQLSFRRGTKLFTKEPQWERTTVNEKATFDEFLKITSENKDTWMYFDYKYLREWFSNIAELKNNIKWDVFGFPELTSEHSTIWIGSAGAHTPCHVDTYGCNLIAQVYGRKQWILCPPEEDLKATRVPYEESSIYSKLNFFSPNIEDFKGVKSCRKIILEPGDVLFVPHKWWHYVENLDTAISVNVWIPLRSDDEERLKESLVQFFISQIVKNMNQEVKEIILNPNSDEDIENMTLYASLNLVSKCKSILTENEANTHPDSDYTEVNNVPFLKEIPVLSAEEFNGFLRDQNKRFNYTEHVSEERNHEELIELIDAFVHPDTLSLIKNKLLR